ncbi:MAG TPA: hypothetical protein PKB12_00595 [Elusimicrobiota bacterium]|jgi:hypothetical protein|nr:hypothetical protein [Elusimicrobiota bacterium]HMX42197.1 hypothetical protein [Elusimicrobiota bacterium]HMX94269.1 hypothetical protein [Elusimicrobiota bacterium]HMZ26118.1 hypothetical protein [Elusimicrobiota bacterium]HNA60817.1 hypothetical protein [Elusimicrobiota bacterium]
MFVVTNSMFGLMILSLGILGIIISFLLTQRTRYFIALGLSTLLVVIGLFFSVGTSLHQWRTARKIAKIQEQNRLTLEAIQSRIRQTPPAATEPRTTPVPAARPVETRRPARR